MKKTLLITLTATIMISLPGCNKHVSEYKTYPLPDAYTIKHDTQSVITIVIEIPEGHYIYANPKGPGTGKATRLFIENNNNFSFGPVHYLPGERHIYPGETEHVNIYRDTTRIFIPLVAPNTLKPGSYSLSVRVESLLCSDSSCIPRNDLLSIPITLNNNAPATQLSEKNRQLYTNALPVETETKPLTKNTQQDAVAVRNGPEQTQFKPRYITEKSINNIIQAIIFGLIAGFILNFMPCVLPVISLKIMGFVEQAQHDRKKISLLGLTFTAGILTSFTALAVLAAFSGYKWGELFQYKPFLLSMIVIIFALALSMFGVFTLNIPAMANKAAQTKKNPFIDSYLKGLLATLLATPCSGPFLGGTLAWALTNPPYIIFIIFISIGLGMSLPYLLLSFNPKLIKFIPKPGKWLVSFERVMGFLLLFTVIYLINILEPAYHIASITFLGIVAIGLWQYGTYGSLINKRKHRIISLIALIVLSVGGYYISFTYLISHESKDIATAQPFNKQLLQDNRQNNVISIVKFTADWCPNCKLVEKLALNTAKVKNSIQKHDLQLLTADITRKNNDAEWLLQALGNYSIPVLALFPPGNEFTQPIVLRDIYSEEDVLKAISLALEKNTGNNNRQTENEVKYKLDIKIDK